MFLKQKPVEYKSGDLVIVNRKGVPTVFKIRKIDSIAQVAESQLHRGEIKESALNGYSAVGKLSIPLSAIIRKATQAEITKAERENKTR